MILAAILTMGLYLRLYHIDYPPIGYHSMKEVNYLSVARGYMLHGDHLHKRVLYSGMTEGPGYLEGLPQFPILPLIFSLLWNITGIQVWLSRMVIVLFSLGNIILIYLAARRLIGNQDIPVISAFFMAVLPISVYFGRNIQPDTLALFFALLATYYFLKWMESLRLKNLAIFSLSAFLAAIIKGTFLISLIPLVFIFPYRKLRERQFMVRILKQSSIFAPWILLLIVWILITRMSLVHSENVFPIGRLFLSQAWTLHYWQENLPLVWEYVGMNYSYLYFAYFLVGVFSCALNARSRLSRYIFGSVAGMVLYFMLISDFAVKHSYYHMPFLPMICLGISAALHESSSLAEIRGRRYLKYAVMVVLIVLGLPSLRTNLYRHFDKLMIGTDVAGRYIREHSDPDERIFISWGSPSDKRYSAYRTQYFGTLWEARRRGALLPSELERVKLGANERNMNWILLFNRRWQRRDRDTRNYINNHYSIRQIGYKDDQILYYLLERDGKFDRDEFEDISKKLARTYEFSFGEIELYVKEK